MNSLKNDTWYIYSNNFEFVPQRANLLLLFFCFFLFFCFISIEENYLCFEETLNLTFRCLRKKKVLVQNSHYMTYAWAELFRDNFKTRSFIWVFVFPGPQYWPPICIYQPWTTICIFRPWLRLPVSIYLRLLTLTETLHLPTLFPKL